MDKNNSDDLLKANRELAFQNEQKEQIAAQLIQANIELAFQNEEKFNRAEELSIANKELVFQNHEKEKRADELVKANEELAFQNLEKEKRAQELVIANIELQFQNSEKQKRAAELNIANIELAFQDEEKEHRAEELIIANKELVFQNREKEKRANELIIANKELAFQNKEKERRAGELSIAIRELVFQNQEKENRASELAIANKELAFQNEEKEKRAAELIIANKHLLQQNKEREEQSTQLTLANELLALQNIEKEGWAAELLASNKELDSFSYSVSHDLRAPLRAINGFTRVLIEEYKEQLNQDAQEILEIIVSNAEKMGQLIDNLLAFSRIGKQSFFIEEINMQKLIGSVIAELRQLEPERVINITFANIQNVQGDRNMLKQVFVNLISNAFKYTGKKKETIIEIGSSCETGSCTYYVRDNGAGFDMRYYDKLFGVFQRLHSTTEFDGTGVGLAIIHKIITKHGGKVWAEGIVKEGACFYVCLPQKSSSSI